GVVQVVVDAGDAPHHAAVAARQEELGARVLPERVLAWVEELELAQAQGRHPARVVTVLAVRVEDELAFGLARPDALDAYHAAARLDDAQSAADEGERLQESVELRV